jgi:hypothetical protein
MMCPSQCRMRDVGLHFRGCPALFSPGKLLCRPLTLRCKACPLPKSMVMCRPFFINRIKRAFAHPLGCLALLGSHCLWQRPCAAWPAHCPGPA